MTFRLNPSAHAYLERLADQVLDNVLDDIAQDAQRLAPVDTGELRASIHADQSAGEVAAEADHAAYVELGTEHMAAQPYLAPALYRKRHLRGEGT